MFLLFIWMCYNSVMLTGSCQCIQRYKSKLAPKGGPPLGWRMDQTQTELLWALLTAGESSTGRDWLDGLKKLDLEQITWGSHPRPVGFCTFCTESTGTEFMFTV